MSTNTETMPRERSLLRDSLRGIPFFVGLNDMEFQLLENSAEFITLRRFEVLFHKGDPCLHLFYVNAGVMKVSSHLNLGREVIRKICHPGMLLGEESLLGGQSHSSMAVSLDRQTHIVKINSSALKRLMTQNVNVSLMFLDYIGKRLKKSEDRLESIIAQDARTRVVNFLKDNALLYGSKVGFNELLLKHNFTQQDIADFTGTSRQTVTTILNDLKRANVIAMNRRRILIRNVDNLA